ncbi:MAG: hypothetical protein MUE97_07355 [Phycisphaerales bacterium]|nr:hypothetical protein [Phycisphaerales bacterium]
MALIDALAAVIILGVSLTVILSLSGQAVSTQRSSDDLATAAQLADEQLSLVLARGADGYASSNPMQGACEAPFERFSYALAITEGAGGSPYRVKVTISWGASGSVEGASGERSLVVETLIAARATPSNQEDRQPAEPVDRQALPVPESRQRDGGGA